jgi:hypothetical protein
MAILDDVKSELRIGSATTKFDSEIQGLIDAAKADLGLSGVLKVSDTDALVKRAIVTYCKANFGWNNPDAERLQRAYESLKAHLSQSLEYARYAVTFTVTSDDVPVAGAQVWFDGKVELTSVDGTATFYLRKANQLDYLVTADGYTDAEGTADVAADTEIDVALTAAG